jgi:hypothetical protein
LCSSSTEFGTSVSRPSPLRTVDERRSTLVTVPWTPSISITVADLHSPLDEQDHAADEILDDGLRAEADADRERAAQEREHRKRNPREIERQQHEGERKERHRPAAQRPHPLGVKAAADHRPFDVAREPSYDPVAEQEQKQGADALAHGDAARDRHLPSIDDGRVLDREELEVPDRARDVLHRQPRIESARAPVAGAFLPLAVGDPAP